MRLANALLRVSDTTLKARMTAALNVDKRARLRDIRQPLLCLYGERDRIVGKAQWIEIHSNHPHSQVCWFDAPHMLLETRAVEAAEAVNEFCDQLV